MQMKSICKHCEYGNRFIDLGQCPECATGRIVGDLHTRKIFCSNLHRITAIAIDFGGQKNCYEENIFHKDYKIIITSEMTLEQIIQISKLLDQTPVQIFKFLKNQSSFSCKKDFYHMIKIGKYLYDCDISFQIIPEVPLLYGLADCFPDLANDYEWVLKINQ